MRPDGKPSARELAGRMEQGPRVVQRPASGRYEPGENALRNLASLSAAYGYEPMTTDHQIL